MRDGLLAYALEHFQARKPSTLYAHGADEQLPGGCANSTLQHPAMTGVRKANRGY